MDPEKADHKNPILYVKDLEPSLRRRIRNTYIIAGIWAGLIFGSAGIFVALMPWMDRRREERIKQAQLAKTTESSEEQKTITPPELRLTEKIEDLKIKATIA